MNAMINSKSIKAWLSFEDLEEVGCYKSTFNDTHIGNPIIRSIHGGATASIIELSARDLLLTELATINEDTQFNVNLVTSSVDYLRVTKAADLFARANIVRIGRRLAFVDVWVWQDNRQLAIARGSCSFKLQIV